jgi:hypothetical protein
MPHPWAAVQHLQQELSLGNQRYMMLAFLMVMQLVLIPPLTDEQKMSKRASAMSYRYRLKPES